MDRDASKSTRKDESNGSKNVSILPDDKQIAARYIQWKALMDKYDKPNQNDDTGMAIDDALEVYDCGGAEADQQPPSTQEEALEGSDEEELPKAEMNRIYAAIENEVASAVQQRTTEWKANGLERIFNSNFSQSIDCVQKWLEQSELGTGKQVTQERETRFTEYSGKTQMDVTHRENVSVLNEAERKQLTAEHSSNYEFCDNDQRRVIVRQIERTTISSYLTGGDPRISNGSSAGTMLPMLPMDSFFGNMTTFTPFKVPAAIEELRSAGGRDRHQMQQQRPRPINIPSSTGTSLSKLLESSLKLVPKARVEQDLPKPQKAAPRARFKPVKKVQWRRKVINDTSSSSESSSSASESSEQSSDESYKPNYTVKPIKRDTDRKNAARTTKPSFQSSSSDTSSSDNAAHITISDSSSGKSSHSIKKTKQPGEIQHRTETSAATGASAATNRSPEENTEQSKRYPLPLNYRQMLSVNGRCRYKTDGTVIYRPKPIHQGLSRNAEKILIQRQDLDLSGVKGTARRQKFDNFSRRTHPNSVLVYYMTDSEADEQDVTVVQDGEEDESSDDDDPILSFRPELCILTFFNDESQKS
uniref:Uncharacterized protein n=1 Tax=Anopheles stephensi TaxID=30069 RepID=A0A182YMF7_ANOST